MLITLNDSQSPVCYSSVVYVGVPFRSRVPLGTSGLARIAQLTGLGSSDVRALSKLPLFGVPVRQTDMRQRLLVSTNELGHADERICLTKKKER